MLAARMRFLFPHDEQVTITAEPEAQLYIAWPVSVAPFTASDAVLLAVS